MANTIALKRRIGSVKNTRQITKAMELVAASKMRRAQEHAAKTRDYFKMANLIINRLRQITDVSKHPLYRQRPINTRLHVLIASDRGLAGAYNSNLFKQLTTELKEDRDTGIASQVVTVGRQGSKFVSRLEGVEIIAAYDHFPQRPDANDISQIMQLLTKHFTDGLTDTVDIIFTDYKSSISQVVISHRLLPAAYTKVKIDSDLDHAVFEPSPEVVLGTITERLVEAHLNQSFSEAQASEQSMRMVAMKNATDNASDLIDDLTLAFNTARQAAITQELAEITGGSEAIK